VRRVSLLFILLVVLLWMLYGFFLIVQITPGMDPVKLQGLKRLWGIVSLISLIMVTILALLASLEKERKKEASMDDILKLVSDRGRQTRKIMEAIIDSLQSPAFVVENGKITFANRRALDIECVGKGILDEESLRENFFLEKIELDINGGKAHLYLLRDVEEERRKIREEEEIKRLTSLGEIASFLSHEIKNSLSVIVALIKSGKTEGILEEVEDIRKLVDQFIEEARPLNPVLRELRLDKNFFGRWPEAEVKGEGMIMADPYILELIFENLVRNSRDAGATRIDVKIKDRHDRVEVEYEDNGKGIEPGDEERIFLPFHTGKKGGTGLGLSFVKKALISMGGNIKAISKKGGAKFLLNLKK